MIDVSPFVLKIPAARAGIFNDNTHRSAVLEIEGFFHDDDEGVVRIGHLIGLFNRIGEFDRVEQRSVRVGCMVGMVDAARLHMQVESFPVFLQKLDRFLSSFRLMKARRRGRRPDRPRTACGSARRDRAGTACSPVGPHQTRPCSRRTARRSRGWSATRRSAMDEISHAKSVEASVARLLEEDRNAAMLMWNQDRVKSALNLKRDQSLKERVRSLRYPNDRRPTRLDFFAAES